MRVHGFILDVAVNVAHPDTCRGQPELEYTVTPPNAVTGFTAYVKLSAVCTCEKARVLSVHVGE